MEVVWDERGGATVLVDGHPQSYVHPEDPELLVFEYVDAFAQVLRALRPDPTPLAVTHIGGAGLTLPRWVHRTHPGSPQIVLEPDTALTALVRERLPLPRGHRIRVRPFSGEEGIGGLRSSSAQVVVLDAFAGGRIPGVLTGTGFARELARVLHPDGLLLVNATDQPGLHWVGRWGATLRSFLPHVGQFVLREIVKGKRFGNVVLVASPAPLDDSSLARAAARATFPTTWRPSSHLAAVEARAGVVGFGHVGEPSPEPPHAGPLRWW